MAEVRAAFEWATWALPAAKLAQSFRGASRAARAFTPMELTSTEYCFSGIPGSTQLSNPATSTEKCMNTNPFKGSVSHDVIIVDNHGNAIKVPKNHKISGSPDSEWLQLKTYENLPTGLRKDGPHSINTHSDYRALSPHAHVPGLLNEDGTPWIPIH